MSSQIVMRWAGLSDAWNASYEDYINGFGDPTSAVYWFGLENFHRLTAAGLYGLNLWLDGKDGNQGTYNYPYVKVLSRASRYALRASNVQVRVSGMTSLSVFA